MDLPETGIAASPFFSLSFHIFRIKSLPLTKRATLTQVCEHLDTVQVLRAAVFQQIELPPSVAILPFPGCKQRARLCLLIPGEEV